MDFSKAPTDAVAVFYPTEKEANFLWFLTLVAAGDQTRSMAYLHTSVKMGTAIRERHGSFLINQKICR